MTKHRLTKSPPQGSPGRRDSIGGDWFFDELMTAQPDATQEYFRARLAQAVCVDLPGKNEPDPE